MPGLEGITFNHYRIQRLLKQGGMSEVYLAHDEQGQREVAIKVVHSSQVGDIKRFQREVKLVGPVLSLASQVSIIDSVGTLLNKKEELSFG